MMDPYKVLGVAPGASAEEIKRAYRKKAKECHPDLHPEDPRAHEKMQQVNEAYTLLTQPEKASGAQRSGAGRTGGTAYGGAQQGYTGSGQQDAWQDAWQNAWQGRQNGWNTGNGGRQWTYWYTGGPEQQPRREQPETAIRPLRSILRFVGGLILFRMLMSLLRAGLFGWWYW